MPRATRAKLAVGYAKDVYAGRNEALRDGTEAVAKRVQEQPLGALLICGRNWFCFGADDDASTAPSATLALLRLSQQGVFTEYRPHGSRRAKTRLTVRFVLFTAEETRRRRYRR